MTTFADVIYKPELETQPRKGKRVFSHFEKPAKGNPYTIVLELNPGWNSVNADHLAIVKKEFKEQWTLLEKSNAIAIKPRPAEIEATADNTALAGRSVEDKLELIANTFDAEQLKTWAKLEQSTKVQTAIANRLKQLPASR